MTKFAKLFRIITIPPMIAALASTILLIYGIVNLSHYIILLITLSLLPTAAYPLSLMWPSENRRKHQRNLALVLSVVGYITGILIAYLTAAPRAELVFYLTYVLSGFATAALTLCFHVKSSGHACGTAGPAVFLGIFVHPAFFGLLLLLIPVFWSSIQTKRHTFTQLWTGAATPLIGMAIATLLIY